MSRDTSQPAKKKRNFFEAFVRPKASNVEIKPSPEKQALKYAPSTSYMEENDGLKKMKVEPSSYNEVKGAIHTTKAEYNEENNDENEEEEESTDLKLALLSSLQPSLAPETLLELLLTCNGSVSEASALAASSKSRSSNTITTQSSLSTYIASSSSQSLKRIPFPSPPIPKFKTLHLSTPSQVPFYAPATLHPSFLSQDVANKLLKECLAETPSFGKYEFRLFERNVSSPHTASFFVKDRETAEKHKGGYMYNGSYLDDIRLFTPTMTTLVPLIEDFVNAQISERIQTVYPNQKKLKHMLPPGSWKITSAFMNCYDGAKQSVGWHSDQLTYLGPRTIIASLSLGVEREFRLRRVAPVVLDTSIPFSPENDNSNKEEVEEKEEEWKWQPEGQLSIHLPHNSLLIMHAECQESWKHSVHPANNITPHPIAGNKRVNITFRCYRESLTPEKLPKCRCGVGCVLKTVQRKKEKMGWYFWGCQVGNQWKDDDEGKEGKEGGCGYLMWAKFDEHGEPIWD